MALTANVYSRDEQPSYGHSQFPYPLMALQRAYWGKYIWREFSYSPAFHGYYLLFSQKSARGASAAAGSACQVCVEAGKPCWVVYVAHTRKHSSIIARQIPSWSSERRACNVSMLYHSFSFPEAEGVMFHFVTLRPALLAGEPSWYFRRFHKKEETCISIRPSVLVRVLLICGKLAKQTCSDESENSAALILS